MKENVKELSYLHLSFFVIYIVVGAVFLLLHIRLIQIIQSTKSIAELPAYRITQHASIACVINIATQIIAVSFTLQSDKMNYTLNSINGAIFQGSWGVEYPTIFILAANRLLAVAKPARARALCNLKFANGVAAFCWTFGAFNTILCLSGQVQTIWTVSPPGFAFTKATSTAMLLYYMDLYFAEFVVVSSLLCYIGLFVVIASMKNRATSLKIELPLTLHFGTNFVMTAVLLYLWHHPVANSDLYSHLFNLINLLRYCLSPVLAILTNKAIRKRFFRRKEVNATVTPLRKTIKS